MTLAEKQSELVTRLATFKSGQDRLAWLMEQAKTRPPLPPEVRTDASLIPGCLAKLWFISELHDGKCFFACDSDSLVVRAIAGLLCEFYSGCRPAEIAGHNPDFLVPLGITQHLTPNRRNALAKVWERIHRHATANQK
jgi:cysteine desulfuration protein SufE